MIGISDGSVRQPDLFEYSPERQERMTKLDRAIDLINRIQGRDTVTIGSQRYDDKAHPGGKSRPFADVIRHDHRSPSPTTRWPDIIKLK